MGHMISFLCCLPLAVWWTIQVFRRYFKAQKGSSGRHEFISTVFFPIKRRGGKELMVDAYCGIVALVIGIITELMMIPFRSGVIVTVHLIHATIYAYLAVPCVLAVLAHRMKKVFSEMETLLYVTGASAFLVQTILFYYHSLGRDGLNARVHKLQTMVAFATFITFVCECVCRRTVFLPLARAFFTGLQATWFAHMAFLLYNPFTEPAVPMKGGMMAGMGESENEEMHNIIMLSTVAFSWHAAAVFFSMMAVGCCIGKYHQKAGLRHEMLTNEDITSPSNSFENLTTNMDEHMDEHM